MTHQPKRIAAAKAVPATFNPAEITAPDNTRHDGWTRPKMVGFLETLVGTGSVSVAAKSVGMSRQSAYNLRARLIGQPFDLAWDAALEFGLQQLHHEALDRAMNGVPVPIYYGGEQVGERRTFPETLTRFLLDNPNAKARVKRDPNVRATSLLEWNTTIARVNAGPLVWTPAEHKKADKLSETLRTEIAEKHTPPRASKRLKKDDDIYMTQEAYDHLVRKWNLSP